MGFGLTNGVGLPLDGGGGGGGSSSASSAAARGKLCVDEVGEDSVSEGSEVLEEIEVSDAFRSGGTMAPAIGGSFKSTCEPGLDDGLGAAAGLAAGCGGHFVRSGGLSIGGKSAAHFTSEKMDKFCRRSRNRDRVVLPYPDLVFTPSTGSLIRQSHIGCGSMAGEGKGTVNGKVAGGAG